MPPRTRWLIRALAVLIVAGAVALAAPSLRGGTRSDAVTGPWELMGGRIWLLPDLDEARVFLPDRPHARREVDAQLKGSTPLERTRSYALSTNAWRLRGGPLQPPSGQRIAVLGDSVALGHGVDDEQAWPFLLEQELQARGKPVQVLNAGCMAASLDDMEVWCRNVGTQLELDLLVWARRGGESGTGIYRQHLLACQRVLDIPVVVVLHPTSAFDLKALREADREAQDLARLLVGVPLLDLNPLFRERVGGREHSLLLEGPRASLLSPSGAVVASGQVQGDELPQAIYQAFEEDSSIREALFIDGAHADVEGNLLYASGVADFLEGQL